MTVLSCMLKTKSMRLAFFREAHEMGAGDADTAEGNIVFAVSPAHSFLRSSFHTSSQPSSLRKQTWAFQKHAVST